jgi:UDP-N-acetylglucosamine 1-carboxyvinyltransferase
VDRLEVEGGTPLAGTVKISGAKNSALPIMAAAIASPDPKRIKNVPDLVDVHTMIELLKHLGAKCEYDRSSGTLTVDPSEIKTSVAPYEIVKRMRASYYVLGSLLARTGQAQISLPGGCAIGARPIDLHIKGIRNLGAKVKVEHGFVYAAGKELRGSTILLPGPKGTSVGATINVMMAATKATGQTVITPAACEPEVVDVADFLNQMGAHVAGAGTPAITIEGVKELHDAVYEVIPDRIEAGTFACAAAITRGKIVIENCQPDHLTAVIETLREIGVMVKASEHSLSVESQSGFRPTRITVGPYPGFPTDTQAQFMAVLALAQGQSSITETIFENRFMQAVELMRMGADIKLEEDTAIINGVAKLTGTKVMASDLRASAALVLAGLAAEGPTEISRIYHLDRGYQDFEKKLASLGAKIKRVR